MKLITTIAACIVMPIFFSCDKEAEATRSLTSSNKDIPYFLNKMANDYRKSCINKIISIIGIKRIFTASTIIGTSKSTNKHRFMGSPIDMYELIDDIDLDILKKFQKSSTSNPMSNTADLSILYTAIKKKMDYLITDNTSDFESILQKMSIFIPNYLQLKRNSDLDYF